MKVLLAVVLALGSVSASGSGPYLPSGWRPEGPAFFLPTETKPATNPLQDVTFQGSEASGSDFLREYGPPKLQDLPKEVRQQAFVEAKFGDEEVVVEAATEAIADLRSALVEEPSTTESQTAESVEEITAKADEAIQGRSLNLEEEAESDEKSLKLEVETVSEDETITQAYDGTTAASVVEVDAKIQTDVVVEDAVKNIAEAIVSLEEKVAEQGLISQDITQFKSAEQISGVSAQVPEGFLEYGPPGFQEYGPPGFKEYGPPKRDAVLRNDEANTNEEEKIDSNETRRRRFSPKFRPVKKH